MLLLFDDDEVVVRSSSGFGESRGKAGSLGDVWIEACFTVEEPSVAPDLGVAPLSKAAQDGPCRPGDWLDDDGTTGRLNGGLCIAPRSDLHEIGGTSAPIKTRLRADPSL